MRKALLYTLLGLLIVSCKKDKLVIEEQNSQPVFVVDGTFNGQVLQLKAGDNGAYMYTESHAVNGVDYFWGDITDGLTSLHLGVFNGDNDIPGDPQLTNLPSSTFACVDSFSTVTLSATQFQNYATMSTTEWFIDGVSNGINTDLQITEPGHYEICFKATFNGGGQAEVCNDMIIGYNRNDNFYIDYTTSGGGTLFCSTSSIINDNSSISSVEWYVNDVLVSTNNSFYPSVGNTDGYIKAKVTFNSGAVREKMLYFNEAMPTKMIEDFSFMEEYSQDSYLQDYTSNLVITVNGVAHYSNIADNSSSSLVINNIEYYGLNNAGNPVYKFDVDVNAKVRKTPVSQDIPISFHAVFGIEVK